jgi:hypothetical protein
MMRTDEARADESYSDSFHARFSSIDRLRRPMGLDVALLYFVGTAGGDTGRLDRAAAAGPGGIGRRRPSMFLRSAVART